MPINHAQVRKLFLAALELPVGERKDFLNRSGAETDVVSQVDELLKHASQATVLDVRSRQAEIAGRASTLALPFLKFLEPFTSGRAARWTTWAVLMALLLAGGQFLRSRVRALIAERSFSVLQSMEATSSTTLEGHLREWQAEVEAVLSSGRAREAAIAAIREPNQTNLAGLHEFTRSLLGAGRFTEYLLASAEGSFVAHNDQPIEPSPASPVEMEMVTRSFRTRKSVIRIPGPRRGREPVTSTNELVPTVTFYLPIIEDGDQRSGSAVGALAISRSMDGLIAALRQSRALATAETYIFSPEGMMLSPSRFEEQMQEYGLARKATSPLAHALIQLRDPGRSLTEVPILEGEIPALWPPTLVVRFAAAARDAGDPAGHQGLITIPYRDYRGEPVVGAWRWLPDLGVGSVVEVDVAEVMAVPSLVDRSLLGLLACVGLAATWGTFSTGWLLRMRGEVERSGKMGAYTLIEKIGEGGMGEVYLAQHALLKRTAAVKLLRRDRLDENHFAIFEREVRVASQLRHPNTVEIYDFGRAKDGTFYYVMQYLPGLDLAEIIKRSGKMPVERTIHIVRQICSALTEAHGEDLLHCDVKPANVMLCSMGGLHDMVKLLDFGLAVSMRNEGESARTDHSGTPYFTAPERLRPGTQVDGRSDIYSLGVLWFYLLTARLPHGAGVHWVEATLAMDTVPVGIHVSVDPEIADLIARCIARDPDARPASTLVLLDQLESLARQFPWTPKQMVFRGHVDPTPPPPAPPSAIVNSGTDSSPLPSRSKD